MPSSAVMDKFGAHTLHSGGPKGPVVTNPKQAVAIKMSEQRVEAKHGGHYPESHFQGGVVSKSSGLHDASYAAGGSVLPRSRDFKKEENTDFLKTKDRFTDRSADNRVSGAPGSQKTDDVYVKPAKCPPPSDKSEAPVRPRQ